MNRVRKRITVILVAVVLIAGAVTGIMGWRNQIQRSGAARTITTQTPSVGAEDVPIVIGPILR